MRQTIQRLFPVPADSLEERRQKYANGLQFRAVCAGAFSILFVGLEMLGLSDPGTYTITLPLLVALAILNVPFWIIGKRCDFALRHFYAHWLIDLIVIAMILHFLGGVDTPYGFFAYLMIVVTSATFISKRASYIVATGATIATVSLVLSEELGVVSRVAVWDHHFTPQVQLVTVAIITVFYFIFAYLAGTLADQLKAANLALAQARLEIQEQNYLLEGKVAERTAELQRRNSEIEEFVHIVTHDLKNLSVGATETARKLIATESQRLSERGGRYAQHLMEDARNMNEMLRHLLAMFRIEQEGKKGQTVPLYELAQEIVRGQSSRIESKNIAVDVKDLPAVSVDEGQIRHVLTNLVDNAIKYVGDKRKREIQIRGETAGGEVVVIVADNGVGIPEDQQDRIFHLYHRAPDQLVAGDLQTGDGVGLAMCKRIVERWGGRIWLTSEVGRGSEFCFSIPIEKDKRAGA